MEADNPPSGSLANPVDETITPKTKPKTKPPNPFLSLMPSSLFNPEENYMMNPKDARFMFLSITEALF